MIKRDITETIYEYDKEGKLIRKTVTETHEEDTNVTNTSNPYTHQSWPYEITCTGSTTATNPQVSVEKATITG
jgi:YD repeat-containing protein